MEAGKDQEPEAPRAILLIGFPAAGKSTWRAAYLARAGRPTAVVSTDDLLHAQAAAEGIGYAEAWRKAGKLDGRARAALRAAVEAGADVVVDRTNLRASARAKFLRLLPGGYQRRAVVFVVRPEILRERGRLRAEAGGHAVAWGFVIGMMKTYEAPSPAEFDLIDYVGPDGEPLAPPPMNTNTATA